MVSCKVMMMENECFNCNNFNIHSWAIWNYPDCWHQMYPHINKSTWLKCWPHVKLMLCSVTLGHQMPILMGYVSLNVSLTQRLTKCQAYIWLQVSLTQRLTKCQADLTKYGSWPPDASTGGMSEYQPDPKAHQMSRWPDVVLLLATRCLYWEWGKSIKMAWDLCNSPTCITFYPYTMFQNPMLRPSVTNQEKPS